MITSVISIAATGRESRRHTMRHGRAADTGAPYSMETLSVTWRESQAAVGCSVTAVRAIFLRSWVRMIVT
jgi:hypothetical protein